ncbi:ATP-binding protein [Acerihabitans sp. TG2]|uniref:hybrid sensor histidine kinase/response regulator n=1 Tax=Acerihabitans sp. TG2 TaxID=3096008 RepID=UPI002B22E1FB|nr:ATP-binding protein [Acerihabitans sp. TG2]MEA9389242.1 ATP-binding protein [Acerihabitans sp. TG2]
MTAQQKAFKARRQYNQWVTNQTLEDYALRFTPHSARRWSSGKVVVTAISAITFLALEAMGGALTLTYGFYYVSIAVLLVGTIIFLMALPISIYAARYGLDIDLLTRGAGFGYIGSTVTSLIYASFTFIFFALEATIMAMALDMLFGMPLHIGYLLSSLVVIPLVTYGFTFISRFQQLTQVAWLILQITPFVLILLRDSTTFHAWIVFPGLLAPHQPGHVDLLRLGAVCSVLLSLVAQVGEQVDQIRFLPKRQPDKPWIWWSSVIAAGPGWILMGGLKIMLGSFLAVLAFRYGLGVDLASEPTHMYLVAFSYVTHSSTWLFALTGIFVVMSQLKINVANAYAGSIAWSNFFLRLTHRHPGRVVWLFFNVGIALLLMELGVYHVFEDILGIYAVAATAWIGTVVADLVVNKRLGFSPPGIEFRRAYLYDINPVGMGSMLLSMALGLAAYFGWFGLTVQEFASLFSLALTFVFSPLIAWYTGGKYYLARQETQQVASECCVCGHHFEPPEMSYCPLYQGAICSLCCSLDVRCNDACKPSAHYSQQIQYLFFGWLSLGYLKKFDPKIWSFISILSLFSSIIGILLMLVYVQMRNTFGADYPLLAAALWKVFFILLIVTGITTWLFILTNKSRQVAQDELRLQSERLVEEIIAHEATDQQLQKAKEIADEANQAKSRYLTGITHELRTPLNAMLGYAQLLEQAQDIPEPRRRGLSVIRRSGEHLANLIEGLLDISKIEAGKMEIHRDEVRIGELMQQLVEMFHHQALDKGLKFIYNPPPLLPEVVLTDENRLRQILINLLSNAIKFTDHGTVTLDFSYRSEVAFFAIHDTGVGIETDHLESIFRPFERVRHSGTHSGTGLGLTITRLLTYVMGGDLQVESIPGAGSTFSLRLMLSSQNNSGYQPVVPWKIVSYRGPGKRLMVVDDDDVHRQLMSDMLTPLGFEVISANSAAQCLQLNRWCAADLFLLDVAMPEMNGWELLNSLRAQGWHQPVLMISAEADAGKWRQVKQRGEIRFQTKPIRMAVLLDNIGSLLQLEWQREKEAVASLPVAADCRVLGQDEYQQLMGLARLGYAKGFRERLQQLLEQRKVDPRTAESLDLLASRFRFESVITELATVEKDHVMR